MIDLTPIFTVLVTLALGLALRYAVPLIKANTTAKEREDMLFWVELAVEAAQQLYYQSSGPVRLQHALSILAEKGFDVTDTVVLSAVEAAVLRLHQALIEETE